MHRGGRARPYHRVAGPSLTAGKGFVVDLDPPTRGVFREIAGCRQSPTRDSSGDIADLVAGPAQSGVRGRGGLPGLGTQPFRDLAGGDARRALSSAVSTA